MFMILTITIVLFSLVLLNFALLFFSSNSTEKTNTDRPVIIKNRHYNAENRKYSIA